MADRLAWLHDVPCDVAAIVGTAAMTLAEIARLSVGSVIALREAAGSDLEVRLSGEAIATGQITVLDDRAFVRLSRILPPPAGDVS